MLRSIPPPQGSLTCERQGAHQTPTIGATTTPWKHTSSPESWAHLTTLREAQQQGEGNAS